MGREADVNMKQQLAEVERLMGPVRDFAHYAELGCPKCGTKSEAFVKRWCSGKSLMNPSREGCQFEVGEHLHVMCSFCHYGWLERTKDMAPMPDQDEPQPSRIQA